MSLNDFSETNKQNRLSKALSESFAQPTPLQKEVWQRHFDSGTAIYFNQK
jgi:hypothetical protein